MGRPADGARHLQREGHPPGLESAAGCTGLADLRPVRGLARPRAARASRRDAVRRTGGPPRPVHAAGAREPGVCQYAWRGVKRIAIVYPRANLDTVPSLIGAAEQFADAGFAVDVFTYRHAGQPDPEFSSPAIRVRPLGVEGLADYSTAGLRSAVKRVGWLPSAARGPLVRTYNVLGAGLASGSRLAARARSAVVERDAPYACVVGVDPDGLALAQTFARGAPVVYYSLELLLSYELSTAAEQQLKARERELSRRAACVIVQDEARARLLVEDNDLSAERVVLVPNSPPGPA